MPKASDVPVPVRDGASRRARGAIFVAHETMRSLVVKPKVTGILRDGKRHRAAAQRVNWPAVFVREEQAAREAEQEGSEADLPRTLIGRLRGWSAYLRVPMLAYDLVLIPTRVAFSGPSLTLIAGACDAFFDLTGLFALSLEITQTELPRDDTADRLAREAFALVPHYAGRALFLVTGEHTELFMLAQALRCVRLHDLFSFMHEMNNDLTTNVRLIAAGKFALVLFVVPHWVCCVWIILAEGWHSWGGAGGVQLPAWPAQFELVTGNINLNPNTLKEAERYLLAIFMSFGGLSGLGYPDLHLTRESEILLATGTMLLHTVFYAFVLGTLFHYFARTDENEVHFKTLLKACEGFCEDRKLPPALAASVTAHYRFQQRKQSSSTDRIFAQMPRTLQMEVSIEQYRREMDGTWAFFGCVPQFLNAIVLKLRERFIPPSQTLFRRGDGALELSWCLAGMLSVTGKDGLFLPPIRSDLGAGQLVGEVAFFLGIAQPHTIAASASTEVMLAYVTTAVFEEIGSFYPEQIQHVKRAVLRKYGLDKNGLDLPNATSLSDGSRDHDEQEDFDRLRESIRLVIVERNEELIADMTAAVEAGDLQEIRSLIERGLDINILTYDGRSALHLAAEVGLAPALNLLTELGADMNHRDRWGATPLEAAVDRKQGVAADVLKSRGAKLDLSRPAHRLHGAVRRGDMDEILLLLSLDLSINVVDPDLRTALHVAAALGNDLVAKLLISSLADVGALDRWGCSPLDDAIRGQRKLVVQLLIRASAQPNKKTIATDLTRYAKDANVDTLQFMLDTGITTLDAYAAVPHYDGRTGLHYAACSGSISTIYLLFAALMNVNMVDRWGRTPLIDALETKSEIAALLSHLGARRTAGIDASAALSAKLDEALLLDMSDVMGDLGERTQARRMMLARVLKAQRELEIALKKSASVLRNLTRERIALAHLLRGTADRWIVTYGVDAGDTDGSDDACSDSDDGTGDESDDEAPDGAARVAATADTSAADAAHSALAAKRFVRVSLQLPRAEEGLLALHRLMRERLDAAGGAASDEQQRRVAEHLAVRALLVQDLELAPDEADRSLDEIYAQLERMLNAKTTAPHGMGIQIDAPDEPSVRARASSRRGSSSVHGGGLGGGKRRSIGDGGAGAQAAALLEMGMQARQSIGHAHLKDPRAAAMSQRRRSVDQHARASSAIDGGGRKPVFISQLGVTVLFTSATLVRALARRGADDVEQLERRRKMTVADADVAAASPSRWRHARSFSSMTIPDRAAQAGALGGGGGRAGALLRPADALAADDGEARALPPNPATASAEPRPISAIVSLTAAATIRREDERAAVRCAALFFEQLLGVFELPAGAAGVADAVARPAGGARAPKQVRLSDVRRLRARLGESGSQQITALHEYLKHAALAFAPAPEPAQPPPSSRDVTPDASMRGAYTPLRHKRRSASTSPPTRSRRVSDLKPWLEAEPTAEPTVSGAAERMTLDGALGGTRDGTSDGSADGREPAGATKVAGGQQPASPNALSPAADQRELSGGAAAGDEPGAQPGADGQRARIDPPAEAAPPAASLRRWRSVAAHVGRAAADGAPPDAAAAAAVALPPPPPPPPPPPLPLPLPPPPPTAASPTAERSPKAERSPPQRKVRKSKAAAAALLNEEHFFPAVAAWILSTSIDAVDADDAARPSVAAVHPTSELDVAGAGTHAAIVPLALGLLTGLGKVDKGLLQIDTPAEASPASEEQLVLPLAASAAGAGVPKAAVGAAERATLVEMVESSVWSDVALLAIADRIEQRLSASRLSRSDEVRPAALLAIVAQVVPLPHGTRADMLTDVCSARLGVEFAADATAPTNDKRGRGRGVQPQEPLTWAALEATLREAVAAGRSSGAWAPAGAALIGSASGAAAAAHEGIALKPWYILSVNSRTHAALYLAFLAATTVDCMVMPIEVSFIDRTSKMRWLVHARLGMDVYFLARIVANFATSFINDKGVEVVDPRACRAAYLSRGCFFDMLAAIPFNIVILGVGATPMQFFTSRVPRILNFRYVYARYRQWSATIDDDDLTSGVLSTMLTFLFTLHLLTAVMVQLGYSNYIQGRTFQTWSEVFQERDLEYGAHMRTWWHPESGVVRDYLVSYYQTTAIITTVGGVAPSNLAEFGFQTLSLLISMTVYAVVVGNLSSLVMKQDEEIVSRRAQLELVQGYVGHIRVPKALKQRLTRFFQARFKSRSLSSIPPDAIQLGLPMELQIEVAKVTNRAVVEAAVILQSCSRGFVDRLSSLMQERAPEAESVIFRALEACKELFFVAAGMIELYDDHPPDEEPVVSGTCTFGDTVGDVPFVFAVRHVQNARAAADMETRMFVLPSTGYQEVLKSFPGMHDVVMENAIHKHEAASHGLKSSRSGTSQRSRLTSERSLSFGVTSVTGSEHQSIASSAADVAADRLHVTLEAAKKRRANLMHIRLCFACARGELAKVRTLLSMPASDVNATDQLGRTALHLAACVGSAEIIQLLIGCNANINAVDGRGATPLVDALDAGHEDAVARLAKLGGRRGPLDMSHVMCEHALVDGGSLKLRTLTQHGVDLNCQTPIEQRTALHVAAAAGSLENVRALLAGGAFVNQRDARGKTPLDESVLAHHDFCSQLLLERAAELGSIDPATCLNQAVFDGDVQHLARLIRFRCNINAADDYGRTPLHLAASCKRVSAMQFLLEQEGLDVNAEDVYGHTPLDDATREEREDKTKVVSALLLSSGAQLGSGIDHTAMQSFRNNGLEEVHLAREAEQLAITEQLLADASALRDWTEAERADLIDVRARIEAAISLEEKRGAVLADEQPELFELITAFAMRQRVQHEHLALDVEPSIEEWIKEGTDTTLEALLALRKAVGSLLSHHDALRDVRRDPIGRLAEVRYRPPETEDGTSDAKKSDGPQKPADDALRTL